MERISYLTVFETEYENFYYRTDMLPTSSGVFKRLLRAVYDINNFSAVLILFLIVLSYFLVLCTLFLL